MCSGKNSANIGWDGDFGANSRSRYIVDFACVEARLIVEADGGQHARLGDHDLRNSELRRQGWRVLRFSNNDILANREAVLRTIAEMLGPPRDQNPPPHPSPACGGG